MKPKKTKNSSRISNVVFSFFDEWKYPLLASLFLYLIWSVRDTSDYNKKSQNNQTVKKASETNLFVDSSEREEEEEDIDSEEVAEKQKKLQEKEAKVLKNYYKEFYLEDSPLNQILERYGYTVENIREFPDDLHKELLPEELTVIVEFQNKLDNFDWGKQELTKYQKLDLTKKFEVSKQRREIINKARGKKEAMESSVLAQLSDDSISDSLHQELCVVLALFSSPKSFGTLLSIITEEESIERKTRLFHPLATVDIVQAMPYLFSLVEKGKETEQRAAITALLQGAKEGAEAPLELFLNHKNEQVADTARKMLNSIGSIEADALLKKYPKEEKKPIFVSEDSED